MTQSAKVVLALVLAFSLFLYAGTSSAQCVDGTVTAELMDAGPFAGLWKYTVDFTWDTPQGLSNVTLDCGFGACPEEVCDKTFAFDTPAGHSDGVPDPCTVEYAGEFNCDGNPSAGIDDPIVKWDAINTEDCEPGPTGTGTLCFYSELGPHPDAPLPIVIIKNGQNVCEGTIMGDCPIAPCLVPTDEITWGGVKGKYHQEHE